MLNEPTKIEDVKAFSNKIPHLQLAWDATSIQRLKTCFRKYYYESICGYRPRFTPIALDFGTHVHSILEYHNKLQISDPLPHNLSLTRTLKYAMEITGETRTIFNTNTNEEETLHVRYTTDDTKRTRSNLLRLIIWYLEHYKDDKAKTLILADGKPALELSFRFDTHQRTVQNESFILCGHIDRVAIFAGNTWVFDYKTTGQTVDRVRDYYTVDDQMTLYSLAANIVTKQHVFGAVLDVIGLQVHANQFGRHLLPRNEAIMNEWLAESLWWMKQAEQCAISGMWPMNQQNCNKYNKPCEFACACSQSPHLREGILKAKFKIEHWDPLRIR